LRDTENFEPRPGTFFREQLRVALELLASMGSGVGAEGARQFAADVLRAPLRGCDPVARGPGRIVANMLLMSAFKIGDPVEAIVQMKPGDLAGSSGEAWLHRFHGVSQIDRLSAIAVEL
jgi:hypothetical protein